MRKAYQRRLPSDTSKDYYFIHRNTGVTQPVIVEYGFLDSTDDDVEQLKNNWQKYADAVVDAVAEYIGVTVPNKESYYTVKSGDSLWSIAKKYDTTVSLLTDINMLTNSVIFPGQVLLIPKGTSYEEVYFENYVVKPGDTIEVIANKLGVDPIQLGLYNDFAIIELVQGQTLKIPRDNAYTVKPDDTVDSILKTTKKTADQLLRANANTWLKTGSKIYL